MADAFADGADIRILKDKLLNFQACRDALEAELTREDDPPPLIPPKLSDVYRRKVADLHTALDDDATSDEAVGTIRSQVNGVVLTPENGALRIDPHGEIAGILDLCAACENPAIDVRNGFAQLTLVAGAGFEPTELLIDALCKHCVDGEMALADMGAGLDARAFGSGVVVHPDKDPHKLDPTDLTGDEVIVAVIDDGIGFANKRFRLAPDYTRIEYFWDMQVPPCSNSTGGNTNGELFRKDQIDEMLAKYGDDEEQIYRCWGMIDHGEDRRQPLKFKLSHGTHVLDIAAGYDYRVSKEFDEARKRPIIAVQLPSEVIAERSDAYTAMWLKLALAKIMHLARELAGRISESRKQELKHLPIVVNFSFGTSAGPHDGHAPIEQEIRKFISAYRALSGNPQCEVIMPAGNGFQSRVIAQYDAGKMAKTEILPWRVLPDDKTSSYVQIWLPENTVAGQQVSVALRPPYGGPDTVLQSKLDHALDWEIDGTVYARIYHQKVDRPGGRTRERILIAIRGTESDKNDPVCPAGLWEIQLSNVSLPATDKIDVRVQRDDSLMGQKRTGRQSYFDHPDYVRFEIDNGRIRVDPDKEVGPVTRRGTFNAYATGEQPVVVGGYRRSDGIPALYSGSGPTSPGRKCPDVAAVSEESASHRGVIAAGTYSGSTAIQNGTSVAAPTVTRILAHHFANGHTRRKFESSVKMAEQSGITGPHGKYRKVNVERQGIGRHFSNQTPHHRRRIDY